MICSPPFSPSPLPSPIPPSPFRFSLPALRRSSTISITSSSLSNSFVFHIPSSTILSRPPLPLFSSPPPSLPLLPPGPTTRDGLRLQFPPSPAHKVPRVLFPFARSVTPVPLALLLRHSGPSRPSLLHSTIINCFLSFFLFRSFLPFLLFIFFPRFLFFLIFFHHYNF